jgi:hypothetical protein
MSRRPKEVGLESAADLARKTEILEREMARQRAALDRLREMAENRSPDLEPMSHDPAKRLN